MERKGVVFDIERFSTKDGKGIRTVVFFKGCNMSCKWCHNPEGIRNNPQLIYSQTKCIACGRCTEVCKTGAQMMIDALHGFDPTKCVSCLKCTKVCFSGALRQVGSYMTVDEIMKEVLADKLLYENSGGGVTLTGGEVSLQADFAKELLKECREQGINTCIETNLNSAWKEYEKMLPYLDCVYADVKIFDSEKHKKWTGVDNMRILKNIRNLIDSGISFCIRTPVIPGINDRVKDITDIAKLLKGVPTLEYYELLSYNYMGQSKGVLVNSPEIMEFEPTNKQHMLELANYAKDIVPTRLDGRGV